MPIVKYNNSMNDRFIVLPVLPPSRGDRLRRADAEKESPRPASDACNSVVHFESARANGTQYALSGCSSDVNNIYATILPPVPKGCGAVPRNVFISWEIAPVHIFKDGTGFYRTPDVERDTAFEDCVIKLGGPTATQNLLNAGAIAGIVIGCVVGVGLLACGISYLYKRFQPMATPTTTMRWSSNHPFDPTFLDQRRVVQPQEV